MAKSKCHNLTFPMSFDTINVPMNEKERKKRLLKAKIADALQSELGRVPTEEEINNIFLTARVMYRAVLELLYTRKKQKREGQLVIF
jgi:hypothetical protein